ncbi:magnesium-transporting ATPase (P-type) [Caldalkalibacillus uzonensis]|uniref:Magnesium-transporting ATPase (P-type) n=1 Tax=Caldalkalibacillus uzonensis TaxID=353224 RepID=A0ABU0CNA3_9BACI|nr:CBO0543 family protein [Caldalkalibacillus uzonensis]MDQ0337903.1 magnesium-transporting ATPase (P-type) [Caldalkalibacillus uzonensis]
MTQEVIRQIEQAYTLVEQANQRLHHIWGEHIIFRWEWWLALALTILPWLIWYIWRKKESTDRLLYAGFFVILVSSWLDFLGTTLGIWRYHIDVIPTIPSFIPWDFSLLPVAAMLVIQVKPQLHPWLKALLFAGLAAYIGEPLFDWLGHYHPKEWKHIYSLPIYALIYLAAHYLSKRNHHAPL